jgi:Ser-tRNA(Ala) deacylase AlaX
MRKLYLEDSYLKEQQAIIIQQRIIKKKTAVVLDNDIFYPGGGGQPFDTGCLSIGEKKFNVNRIVKIDDSHWLCLDSQEELSVGTEVFSEIHWERRYLFMRCHTTAHLVMGAIKRHVEGYSPEGIEISENGDIALSFSGKWDNSRQVAEKIIQMANETIKRGGCVYAEEFSDIGAAVAKYSDIFRGSTDFKGNVRIVIIEGWDANPCGGTHIKSLDELNEIVLSDFSNDTITIRAK